MGTFDIFFERLREERERLGYNQTDFAAIAGVGRKTQFNYETGDRIPDAAYLAAITTVGADVPYILTGERDGPPPLTLAADEEVLLDGYRGLDKETKKRMLAFVLGGDAPKAPKHAPTQVFHSGVEIGQHIQGDQTYNKPVTISVGGGKKKK